MGGTTLVALEMVLWLKLCGLAVSEDEAWLSRYYTPPGLLENDLIGAYIVTLVLVIHLYGFGYPIVLIVHG